MQSQLKYLLIIIGAFLALVAGLNIGACLVDTCL